MIKFIWNSEGQLAYRSTGKLAQQGGYTVRGNRVYQDGRLKGYVAEGTKAQQAKAESAAQYRARTSLKRVKVEVSDKGRVTFKNIDEVRKRAGNVLYRPRATAAEISKFGENVRNMALNSAGVDNETYLKIQRMDDRKLKEMYDSGGKMIFEVYFDYGGISKTEKGLVGGTQTAENARFLVEEYERRYGVIL